MYIVTQLEAILTIQCRWNIHSRLLPTITIRRNVPKSPYLPGQDACFACNQFSIRLVFLSSMWHFSYQDKSSSVAKPEIWFMVKPILWGILVGWRADDPATVLSKHSQTGWRAPNQKLHKKSFPVYWTVVQSCPKDVDPREPAGSWELTWQWAAWLLFAEPLDGGKKGL